MEFEAVQMGNAGSASTSGPKTGEMEAPKTGEIENSRSGSTSGPLCFAKKVVCGAALESKVVDETKVDSELAARFAKALEEAKLESGPAEE